MGAELAQAYKPDPEAYLRTVDILAMRPDEVCMVAAHNGDLAAARACGLATAFVPRPNEHGPGQTTDLQPEQDWDVVARTSASWRTSSAPSLQLKENRSDCAAGRRR